MAKKQSGVREIRTALGKSRPHFAEMLGVSAITIKRLELGSLPLSKKLEDRFQWTFGVSVHHLRNGRAITMLHQPFTRETFDWWKAFRDGRSSIPDTVEASVGWARLLLEAAAKKDCASNPTGRLHQVRAALADALNQIVEDFGLRKIIDEELVARAPIEYNPLQVEAIKLLWRRARQRNQEPPKHNLKFSRKLRYGEVAMFQPWEPLSIKPPPSSASRSPVARAQSKTRS